MQNAKSTTGTHSVRLGLWVITHRTGSDQITPFPGFLSPQKEIGGAAQDDGAGRRTDQIQYEETKNNSRSAGNHVGQNSRLWKLVRSLGVLGSHIWPCRGISALRKAWKPFRTIT